MNCGRKIEFVHLGYLLHPIKRFPFFDVLMIIGLWQFIQLYGDEPYYFTAALNLHVGCLQAKHGMRSMN